MVVAGPRPAQLGGAGAGPQRGDRLGRGELHQPLEDVGDRGPGQPVMPVLALGADRDQSALGELFQVGARCGTADVGLPGQQAGGELPPRSQGDQDPAPSPVCKTLKKPANDVVTTASKT